MEYSVNTNLTSIEENYSNASSSPIRLGIETLDESNSSSRCSEIEKPSKLKLTMGLLGQTFDLNTPDVIESVVELENNFNILDYVNEKDITTVKLEDIHFENISTSRGLNENFTSSNSTTTIRTNRRRPRLRRYEDDDEEYVPPTKKNQLESSDSESEVEVVKCKKREKPMVRRTSSISSDHSDASKYRELRDKNNEASRKSRLKRKMKEMTLQREADELYERNVQLKAQVAEYERMVNTFRSNLFKLMLKK